MSETIFPYHDFEGRVVYEVVRTDFDDGRKKTFTQRTLSEGGERISGLADVPRVPYMLPLLLKGIKYGNPIFFVEGEKCANALVKRGLIATTCCGGSSAPLDGGTSAGFLRWFQGAKEIIVICDADIPGRQAAVKRAGKFCRISENVRYLDLDPDRTDGYDVADWLEEDGGTPESLLALAAAAPLYDPPKIETPNTKIVEGARIFTLADLLSEAVKRTEEAVENGPRIQPSPWQPLNFALGGERVHSGFSPSETVIWAAVPGGGKSAATWMVADHAAAKHDGTAVLVSAEMGEIDAVQRLISLYSGVTTGQLRSGQLSAQEWEKLSYVSKGLASRRLAIIGRDGRDLVALKKSIDTLAGRTRLSCIVVDHIGKILQGKSDVKSRNDAAEGVIEELANMAIEYDCVMHVVQHLNRQGYGQRPTLANLRDGGNTEGHANIVIFPYRKYPNAPNLENREKGELILEKCRDGYTGSLPMKYVGERYLWQSSEESGVWFERE